MICKSAGFFVTLLATTFLLTSMVLVQAAPITIDAIEAVAAPNYSPDDSPFEYNYTPGEPVNTGDFVVTSQNMTIQY
ncbi:hypothetical protein BGZ96_008963 [Linnemannia gamsii]|uniref:Uncharacterized protein n=1 Tax=Linnemannia gamsii TaxID=64522 RepID=A0ABQ7JXJ1_9FUNG|nr:hypothetical protein BGZ96_008963 [Linnemannia gamsii]